MSKNSALQQWTSQKDPQSVQAVYAYTVMLLNETMSTRTIVQRLEQRGLPKKVAEELIQDARRRAGKTTGNSRGTGLLFILGGIALIIVNILMYVIAAKLFPSFNPTLINVTLVVAGLGLIGKGLVTVIVGH